MADDDENGRKDTWINPNDVSHLGPRQGERAAEWRVFGQTGLQ